MKQSTKLLTVLLLIFVGVTAQAQKPAFKVIAFFTGKNDMAHISFVKEANQWFPQQATKYNFQYDTTSNWNNLNESFLKQYAVVLFLDTRPELPAQRTVFENYMKNGGAWIGFHFAAFALPESMFPDNWPWYHNEFLGSGNYSSNTWRPTSAILKVENSRSPITKDLPKRFSSSANEWYRWENDLTKNPNIDILLSIDSSSFPLGTGPKPHEIWHSGYYPVVWSNRNYRMVYMNMGHNDIDYENKTNKELSFTFDNPTQNKLIINSLLWLGKKRKAK